MIIAVRWGIRRILDKTHCKLTPVFIQFILIILSFFLIP